MIMARNNNGMRLIRTEIDDIFTADSRTREIEIPVFSFSGVTYASTSPPWFPSSPIRLTRWQLAAGAVGEGQTPSYSHFQIIVGDSNLDQEGQAMANGALDGADLTTFMGEQVAVPRTYSYKAIYNLDDYMKIIKNKSTYGSFGSNNHSLRQKKAHKFHNFTDFIKFAIISLIPK
jgi:hypothetical protein